MADKSNQILKSSLGSELSDEEAQALAGLMSVREFSDGDYLIEEGSNDEALHILASGKLEVVKRADGGDTASLAILRDGDLAGELSFVDGEPHTVGLRALTSCQVLSLARRDFENIIDDEPRLAYKVMRAITRSAHRIVHRMNYEFVELNNYIFKQHGRY